MGLHLVRALIRVSVLIAGDSIALVLVGTALFVVRDLAWLGANVAAIVQFFMPRDALSLEQFVPGVLLGLVVLDNYGSSDRRRDASRLFAGATFGLALPCWAFLWNGFTVAALPGFAMLAVLVGAVLIAERHLIDRVVRRMYPVGRSAARVLLVGSREEALRAADHPALMDTREFVIAGSVDLTKLDGATVREGARRFCRLIKRYHADTVVLGGALRDDIFSIALEAARTSGCQVLALTRAFALSGVEPRLIWRRGAPLVSLTRPMLLGRQLVVKRTLDVCLSLLGFVLLAPVFLFIAAAVKASSPGPVFFRQSRVGLVGRRFKILKFRSMVLDAEAKRDQLSSESLYADRRLFKLRNDPRVTAVGRWLRRTSLDELPQLWNVLRGEMSLVGPRPPLPSEVELYEEHHYARFDVKPGMTGPWQANGRNTITDFEQVIRLETEYIKHWTIWKDVAIILKTVPTVLQMRGAH